MKKYLIIFSALIIFPIISQSADLENFNERFKEANSLFEKGQIQNSLDIYTALVAQGAESSQLYYNIGNTYFRRGERGKALLWYERARRLEPRDKDILFNLSLSRSHIKQKSNRLIERFLLFFSEKELMVFFTIFLWIFFIVLGGRLTFWRTHDLWPSVVLWTAGFFLFSSGGLLLGRSLWVYKPLAIVTSAPAEVRNGPGTDYAVGFTLPEGTDVLVINPRTEWTEVGVPQEGLKGWIPSADIEQVNLPPIT